MNEYRSEQSEYNGNALIALFKGDTRIVSFGIKKAKAIIACIDAIREFVIKNDVQNQDSEVE